MLPHQVVRQEGQRGANRALPAFCESGEPSFFDAPFLRPPFMFRTPYIERGPEDPAPPPFSCLFIYGIYSSSFRHPNQLRLPFFADTPFFIEFVVENPLY